MDLGGRVAILTGAGKGMGPAIAEALARAGADVALSGRDMPPVEAAAAAVRRLGARAVAHRCDVTDAAAVEGLVEAAKAAFGGRVDILVAAAGATGPVERAAVDTAPEEFDAVVATNLRGAFLSIRAVLPTMMAQRYGKIVTIGGTWGLRGRALRTAYGATKWGLRGIVKSVALEAGPCNVNVNNVCPGIVEGPRFENTCRVKAAQQGKTVEEVRAEAAAEYALRRFSTGADVANAVVFLCSEKSRQITGQDIAVDGGWVI